MRWLERVLLVLGVVCLGYYTYQTVEARQFQHERAEAFRARLNLMSGEASTATPTPDEEPEGVLALLEIPRLDLWSPVLPGDGPQTLDVAVGHLPDTPKPWEPGNSAFAAHRDGLFRPLRRVRIGDEVRVRTEHGTLLYRVTETKVVAPTDLSVLAPQATDVLTLITCYPFNFVGNAPQRFIVHASRVSESGGTSHRPFP